MAAFIAKINENITNLKATQEIIAGKDSLTEELEGKLTFDGTTLEKEDLGLLILALNTKMRTLMKIRSDKRATTSSIAMTTAT